MKIFKIFNKYFNLPKVRAVIRGRVSCTSVIKTEAVNTYIVVNIQIINFLTDSLMLESGVVTKGAPYYVSDISFSF